MCDTLVAMPPATADGAVWLGKNSDREPGEAQLVEHVPGRAHAPGARLRCTYLEIAQAERTNEILISRPFWMWGAEMGVNQHGLAIGNEAVFTRVPVAATGLTGMDLVRLALERAASARAALDVVTALIAEHGQGGGCGHRQRGFTYHNSFVLADPAEAWVLETAGPHWVAQRVRELRTISNALSIGQDFDLVSEGAYPFARGRGWCRSAADFDFARCFGAPAYRLLAGGAVRSACTLRALEARRGRRGRLGQQDFFDALRDHASATPDRGWRMTMPCAHASWQPTRRSGQTTASMVCRLHAGGPLAWLTGTSSPCISVFKPVALGGPLLAPGPAAGEGHDPESLFWRHERLHRLVLAGYDQRRAAFEAERLALEARFAAIEPARVPGAFQACWDEHRQLIPGWVERAARVPVPVRLSGFHGGFRRGFHRYWAAQSALDRVPAPDA
jgi:secernin